MLVLRVAINTTKNYTNINNYALHTLLNWFNSFVNWRNSGVDEVMVKIDTYLSLIFVYESWLKTVGSDSNTLLHRSEYSVI